MPKKPTESRTLPDGTVEKRCTKCGKWKPATREHFAPNKGGLLGLRPDCKPCVAKMSRVYHTGRREKDKEYIRAFRRDYPERARELDRKYRKVTARTLKARELRAMGQRECHSCHRVLPATLEYFPEDRSRKSGIYPYCLECNRAKAHEYYLRKRDLSR